MDWTTAILTDPKFLAFCSVLLASALIYWRAGSLHPVYLRLLRLFISREDVVDETIKEHLAEQSALVAFTFTSGVQSATLKDAKAIYIFSRDRNIPLSLIAASKEVFDLKSLSINPKLLPKRWHFIFPGLLLYASIMAGTFFAMVASNSKVLVSLKATDTWIWLDSESARRAAPSFGERRVALNSSRCVGDPSDGTGFTDEELVIVCSILRDPELDPHISQERKKQRTAALFGILALTSVGWMSLSNIQKWLASRRLNGLLSDHTTRVASDAEQSERSDPVPRSGQSTSASGTAQSE